MRIISKGNDYYDSAQAYGQDLSIIYKRKEVETTIDRKEILPDFKAFDTYVDGIKIDSYLIGFCGKVYPVYYLELVTSRVKYVDNKTTFYVYTVQEVEKLLAKYKYKKALIEWNERDFLGRSPRGSMLKHSSRWRGATEFINVFTKFDTPIWVYTGDSWIKGKGYVYKFLYNVSNLKQYNFFRVWNAFEAYQEISAFMESTLTHEKQPDPTNVPDCYLAAQKGFDSWSFRKQPTKKGRKAKKRSLKCS